ncbi:MAG: diaminopimelate epimerase [Rhodocyclaceae bacterium]|nr:diaminopimelate epimerase [Rhodocyclaceae bacterium]
MKLKFSKMQGLGNDFVVLDAVRNAALAKLSPAQAKFLADRHFGVGCDQILIVQKPTRPDVDFRYRIFNADGGEVEQCGNGARCFVRFVHDEHLSDKRAIKVETQCGVLTLTLEESGEVTVDMGEPHFQPDEIPFISDSETVLHALDVNGKSIDISVVSMGNPHAVQVVPDAEAFPVHIDGPVIESHPRFPKRVNAGFMQVDSRNTIHLRVYERGAGETLACGTGACAAVVAGIRRGLLDSPVRVTTHGGDLSIAWAGDGHSVMMTGPAVTVFTGTIEIPDAND